MVNKKTNIFNKKVQLMIKITEFLLYLLYLTKFHQENPQENSLNKRSNGFKRKSMRLERNYKK